MEIDEDKIDDAVLALLWLTLHNERCAWKGFDWATTDRLHKKGMIGDPVNKSKSLILTDEGLERSEALFRELLGQIESTCKKFTQPMLLPLGRV
ncbi:DUF6429 family protein [Rhizobium sp.]|jgi:hypothetical protein|nr:hypothetical protein [Rhizobium sp.]